MFSYQKSPALWALLYLFVTFFAFQAYAQPAKVIPISEWGSNAYADVVELGEYYYFRQENSKEIEVYGSLVSDQSARLGTIAFDGPLYAIFKFNGLLVAVDSTTLSLYQVDGLNQPKRIYGISVGQGANSTGNSFAVSENKLAYIADDNTVFVLQVEDNQYSIFKVYTLDSLNFGEDVYFYRETIGFTATDIFVASIVQQYVGDVWTSKFIVAKLSLQDDFAVSLEFEIDPLESDIRTIHYLKDGAFIVDAYEGDNVTVYGVEDGIYGVINTISKTNQYVIPYFTSTDTFLWSLTASLTLQRYDISDLSNIKPLESTIIDSSSTQNHYFQTIAKGDNKLIALSQVTIHNIELENSIYANNNQVFYRGGYAEKVAIKNDKLYIPIADRIDVVDVSLLKSPKLVSQVKPNFRSTVGSLYPLEDDLLSLTQNDFVHFGLDSEGLPSLVNSVRIDEYLYYSLVEGDTLFVKNNENQILRYNISSANSLYELPFESEPLSEQVNDFYHKVLVDDYLVVVDYDSDGRGQLNLIGKMFNEITFLSRLTLSEQINAMATFEGYIYTISNRKINIYQIENDTLVALQSLIISNVSYPTRLDIINGYLLVSAQTNGSGEISLYSLTNPVDPSLISTTKLNEGQNLWSHSKVVIDGSNLYVTGYSDNGKTLILQLNKAPTLDVNDYVLDEDSSVTLDLADLDPENDQVTVEVLTAPENGELTFNEFEQTLTYLPAINFYGEETAKIKLLDSNGNFSESTINFSVTPVNDLPSFNLTTLDVLEGGTLEVSSIATDVENDSLTYEIISDSSEGVTTISEEGVLTFTSLTDFSGETSITISITDGLSDPVEQTIVIRVKDVNDAPRIAESEITLNEDEPKVIPLIIIDVEGHDTTLEVVSFADGLFSVDVSGANGLDIVPKTNFNGDSSIVVKVTDELNLSAEYTLAVKVLAVNDVPVFTLLDASIAEDTVFTQDIVATDVDGDTLTLSMTEAPSNGVFEISEEGSITYTPSANFNGTVVVGLSVTDGIAEPVRQNFTIEVTPINDAPIVIGLSFEMFEDTNADIVLNISDAENDSFTLSVVEFSDGIASVEVTDDGKLSVKLVANFFGQATVKVKISDENQASENYTLAIEVKAVDDLPNTEDINVDATKGNSVSGTLPTEDVDGETLAYSILTPTTNGTVTLEENGAYTYIPNSNFSGSDSFTYTVTDFSGNSVEAKVKFSVKAKQKVESNDTDSGGGGSTLYLLFVLTLLLFWRVNYQIRSNL